VGYEDCVTGATGTNVKIRTTAALVRLPGGCLDSGQSPRELGWSKEQWLRVEVRGTFGTGLLGPSACHLLGGVAG
jgi:hypothetical protein